MYACYYRLAPLLSEPEAKRKVWEEVRYVQFITANLMLVRCLYVVPKRHLSKISLITHL